MKFISKIMMAAVLLSGMAMMAGCEKESNPISPRGTYYYNLYTETQDFNRSNFDAFAPLWDENGTIMFSITDTRDKADKQAVAKFNDILSQIDDERACEGLHGDDYVKAIMQRVEGRPHDLKSKTWTANGVEEDRNFEI